MCETVEIPLTQGLFAVVDVADASLVSGHKWHTMSGAKAYAGYWNGEKVVPMHRLLMGPPEGYVIDHIDGDGLNNRRENLRVCTQQQNLANSAARIGGTCRIVGGLFVPTTTATI